MAIHLGNCRDQLARVGRHLDKADWGDPGSKAARARIVRFPGKIDVELWKLLRLGS